MTPYPQTPKTQLQVILGSLNHIMVYDPKPEPVTEQFRDTLTLNPKP